MSMSCSKEIACINNAIGLENEVDRIITATSKEMKSNNKMTLSGIVRKSYDAKFKCQVVMTAESINSIAKAAKIFNVDEANVRRWRRDFALLKESGSRRRSFRGPKEGHFKAIDEQIISFIQEQTGKGLPITRKIISCKALEVSKKLNILTFKASLGWCRRLMKRYNFSLNQLHSDLGEKNENQITLPNNENDTSERVETHQSVGFPRETNELVKPERSSSLSDTEDDDSPSPQQNQCFPYNHPEYVLLKSEIPLSPGSIDPSEMCSSQLIEGFPMDTREFNVSRKTQTAQPSPFASNHLSALVEYLKPSTNQPALAPNADNNNQNRNNKRNMNDLCLEYLKDCSKTVEELISDSNNPVKMYFNSVALRFSALTPRSQRLCRLKIETLMCMMEEQEEQQQMQGN